MEQWKMSIITGAILIVIGIILTTFTSYFKEWLIIVIILGILDVILGLYQKKRN